MAHRKVRRKELRKDLRSKLELLQAPHRLLHRRPHHQIQMLSFRGRQWDHRARHESTEILVR